VFVDRYEHATSTPVPASDTWDFRTDRVIGGRDFPWETAGVNLTECIEAGYVGSKVPLEVAI